MNDNLTYTLSLIYKGLNNTSGKYTGLYMGLCLPEECNSNNHSAIVSTLNLALDKMGQGLYVGTIVDNPYEFEF